MDKIGNLKMRKTILITGSTDGIGKLTAIKIAKEGHAVYLHGRNPEKLSLLIAEIKTDTNNKDVKGFVADFSDMDSVKQMGQQIANEASQIDALINNAGVFKSAAAHNKDGLDLRFAVNYLAPYLLTNAIIPLLNKGTDPRIINLSSAAQSPVSHKALTGEEGISSDASYAQSKLALTMWSFYLAKKLDKIAVIAVNPGSLLNTKMANEAYGQYWAPADKGADILYDLAISKDYKGVTGKYFDNDQGVFAKAHPDAYNKASIDKLINTTNNLINL
jgi:NAD(P)-dependent dehydrogenase (short-subunit alcohol dehydrogenase family)